MTACTLREYAMSERDLYLVAYDVADRRRRKAALDLVKGFSAGGQRSVHECFLSPAEKGHLIFDTSQFLDDSDDRFLVLRLDPRSRVFALGRAVEPADRPFFYLG